MTLARAAISAVAAGQRRRAAFVIGLAAGLAGGLVAGGTELLVRTATAPARLAEAVDVGDARVSVFAGTALADDIAALDLVDEHVAAQIMVARLAGEAVVYFGTASLPTGDLMQPVVVDGRRPDPARADEVMVFERVTDTFGIGSGDDMTLSFLTAEEVTQFDTGFGEPDGATVRLRVVGVARVPDGLFDTAAVLTTPAFAAAHPESVAGVELAVRLRGGRSSLDEFADAVAAQVATAAPTPGGEEFVPALVEDPMVGTEALERSSRVLIGGLSTAVMVAGLASLLALAQAMARHHASSASTQQVERALGMTATERALARTLPWVPGAVAAGAVTVAVGLVAGALEPIGPLRAVEPSPGWRPDLVTVGVTAIGTIAVVLLGAFATAWRSGRAPTTTGPRAGTAGVVTRLAPRRHGWALAGAVFALSTDGGRGRLQLRTSLAAATLGVAGMVSGLTFAATLERAITEPSRSGWTTDLGIADVDDELVAGLAADMRFAAVIDVRSATVRITGPVELPAVPAYSFEPVRGSAGWVYHEGRAPRWSGEVALGTRAAEQLDVELGDRIDVAGLGAVEVVGIGLGPPLSGEPLGSSVLLDPDAAMRGAADTAFREVLLRAAPGESVDALVAELSATAEVIERELPPEVQDLADLGRLPEVLGAFLAGLGLLALAHAVVVTARHRARDVAVLRALGSTPRQTAFAIVAMAFATVTVGLVVGVPLGWATARLVWAVLAQSIGIEPGVALPPAIALVVAGALALAALVAAAPARRVARQDPASLLRVE